MVIGDARLQLLVVRDYSYWWCEITVVGGARLQLLVVRDYNNSCWWCEITITVIGGVRLQ